MIRRILILFLVFSCSNIFAMDALYYTMNCNWIEKNPMLVARSEFSTLTHDNNIYVVGGVQGEKALSDFEKYNPKLDKWTNLSKLPIEIHHASLGTANNKIYLIGGFTKDISWQNPNHNVYEYDILKDSWKKHDSLQTIRVAHTAESIDNEIYLIAGHGYKPSRILKYNPVNKKIIEIERMMPKPADHVASVKDKNGNLIILGGRDGSGNLNIVRFFDMQNLKWFYNDSLPINTSGHVGEFIKEKIHIIGGEDIFGKKVFDDHWFFDFEKNKWFESKQLPIGLHGMGSGVIRNKLYLFGGATGAGTETYNTVQNKNYMLKCY